MGYTCEHTNPSKPSATNEDCQCPIDGLESRPRFSLHPYSTIISFETGVFYRSRRRIGLKVRCPPCNGRFRLNEFLRLHFLEADANQTTCHYKTCFSTVWEGSKFCQEHFLTWRPDMPDKDEMKVLIGYMAV